MIWSVPFRFQPMLQFGILSSKLIYILLLFFSSRDVVFSAIKRLTKRAEKFASRDKKARENDMAWIERKLTEGNFRQVRDISQSTKPTPTKEIESPPMSPKRLDSPVIIQQGRGKRTKFLKSTCDLECCALPPYASPPVRRAIFFDNDLEIEEKMEEEEAIPDDGDPDYIDESEPKPKPEPLTPRPTFENVLALQARFNTPDAQVALWWNMVSL